MIPVSPPVTNMKMKPAMKSSGVRKRALPMTIVQHQAKTWIVDGMTTIAVAAAKKTIATVGMPGGEHVVRPDAEADEDDEQLGDRDERERLHPPLRERGDDLGRDPERGDDQDVDLGVAEEPEEVLPEERRAAAARRRRSACRRCGRGRAGSCRRVSTGSAKRSPNDAARNAKQKSGIRFSDIPGARDLKIVTMNCAAVSVEAIAVEDDPEAVEVDRCARGRSVRLASGT